MTQASFQHPQTLDDQATSRSMRWFLLIIVSLWTLAALTLPIVAFCVTRNAFCFAGFTTLAPPVYIFSRITKSFFPMHERDYELEMLRITYSANKEDSKKQMPLKP